MKHFFFSLALLLTAVAAQAQVSTTFSGALTNSDPFFRGGRLTRSGVTAVCGTTKTFPGTTSVTKVRFDTYTISNPSTTASVCATLTLTPSCSEGTGDYLFCSVYATSFDTTNIATNYRSDMGASPTTTPLSMGVTVAPREVLKVVISGVTSTARCSSYALKVDAPVTLAVQGGRAALSTLTAYPNPVEDVLRIAAAKPGSYTLYSATGAVVKQFTGAEVSLRGLPGGVYLLQHDATKAATRVVKL